MKVFITGATGFVGTAVVQELIASGHQVIGLARSESAANKLTAAGAAAHYGDLEDADSLRRGAAEADAVIHVGFIHDFSRFQEVCEVDRAAIETMGAALAGTNKPFIVTSGVAMVSPGKVGTEDIIPPFNPALPRVSEIAADKVADLGVRASVIRLAPSVHGKGDVQGFVPLLMNIAREKGASAYIGAGENRWCAVNVKDAAVLYRLALEHATPKQRIHAIDEYSIPFKAIAEAIAQQLNLPVIAVTAAAAEEHFGWFKGFAGNDMPASSEITREKFNWKPDHSTLLEDIRAGVYS